ncbi:unnamed protein product [Polarella glacialis]|uniref:Uncharacterized protein n=1 Tax=Polarella glacialis TaxID=89957 RepID=A0A813CYM7_POLGL|nr:unnamed protein product [Polarella glacialis]
MTTDCEDWDDTLFPTTELFDRWRLPSKMILKEKNNSNINSKPEVKRVSEVSIFSASTCSSVPQKKPTSDQSFYFSLFGGTPAQKKKPSPATTATRTTTAEHPSTGKQQQPSKKAGAGNNVVLRLMSRMLSSSQKVQVGVDVKEEEEEQEEEEEWGFPHKELIPAQSSLLKDWQSALFQYLTTATALSSQVVIVTNSRRPWVNACVNTFAPACKKFFATGAPGSIKVVYAKDMAGHKQGKGNVASKGWDVKLPVPASQREFADDLTAAKFHAMQREAKAFYSSYEFQSWKNIISVGDMLYEHNAVFELARLRRVERGSREQLRVKSLLLPDAPRISELTLHMCFSKLMLPVYVRFDGDLDLNLQDSADPLLLISQALNLPEVMETHFPRHAWGIGKAPACQKELGNALLHLEAVVQPIAGGRSVMLLLL